MKNSDKNMLLVVVVTFVAIMTLGGLGNAAYSINSFYWVPFVIVIPFFVYVCYKLFKAGDIAAKDECKDKKEGR